MVNCFVVDALFALVGLMVKVSLDEDHGNSPESIIEIPHLLLGQCPTRPDGSISTACADFVLVAPEANAEHSFLSARRTSRGIAVAGDGPPLKKSFVAGRGQRRVSD